MRTTFKILIIIIVSMIMGTGALFAFDTAEHDVEITIEEVVKLDINDLGMISLSTIAPGTGGLDVTGDTDSTKWLTYTSLVGAGTRKIQASLDANISVGGVLLRLVSAAPVGNGTVGIAAAAKDLDTTPRDIVTGIGSCATGVAAGNGANLTYSLIIDDVGALVVTATQIVTVTLTLTDQI